MKRLLLSCTAATLIAILCVFEQAWAAPIVEYTFSDGNASVATNTGTLGAAMNGSITGGTIAPSSFSPDNQALLLGGNSFNGISMPNGYDFGTAFTVESLIRLETFQNQISVIFDDFGGPGVLLAVTTSTQQLRFQTTTADNGSVNLTAAAPLTLGEWHHVAGMYDGSVLNLYLDGGLVASQAASGLVLNNAGVAPGVGVESDGEVFPWDGAIDDFRIYDTALSITELNGGTPIPAPVPEPSTILLFGTGIVGLIGYVRRRNQETSVENATE